jgi:hypothetical protein
MQHTIAILESHQPETRETLMAELFAEMNILDVSDIKQITLRILEVHQQYHINMMFTDQQLAPVDLYSLLIEIFELTSDAIQYQTIFECQDQATSSVKTGMVSHSSTILLTLSGLDLDGPQTLETLLTDVEIIPTMDVKAITGASQCQDAFAHNVYLTAPMMLIYVQKPGEEGTRQAVYPSDVIHLTEQQQQPLHISSIITHTGEIKAGHYQAYINYNNQWYLYDDMSTNTKLKLVSSETRVESLPDYDTICQNAIYYIFI